MKFILLFLMLWNSSWAEDGKNCQVQVEVENVNFARPLAPQQVPIQITVSRQKRRSDCNHFYVGISAGQAGNYQRKLYLQSDPQHSLAYNFYGDSHGQVPLKALTDVTQNEERLSLYIPTYSSSVTQTVYARLPYPNQGQRFFKKGFYRDQVMITAKAYLNHFTPDATANISLISYVEPNLEISLVDRGAPFDPNATSHTLNFGELENGKQLGIDLRIRSNAGYRIEFASQNNGKLKHLQYNDTINYELKVQHTPKSLGQSAQSPVEVARSSGITSENGQVLPIDIEIKNHGLKRAGNYMDYITITAMTIE